MIKNAVAALIRGYFSGSVSSQRIDLAADLHRELSEEVHLSCEVGQLKEILWKLCESLRLSIWLRAQDERR